MRCGACRASACAMQPPVECPSTTARSTPAMSSTARQSRASSSMVQGALPRVLAPMPRWSKLMTRKERASVAAMLCQKAAVPPRPLTSSSACPRPSAKARRAAPSAVGTSKPPPGAVRSLSSWIIGNPLCIARAVLLTSALAVRCMRGRIVAGWRRRRGPAMAAMAGARRDRRRAMALIEARATGRQRAVSPVTDGAVRAC